ncbi:MAG: ABC transporter permease [Elusimicrobiales bacterium]
MRTIIKPGGRFSLADLAAIWQYRELGYFLVKRDVSVRYKQTLLGGLWAVLQPTLAMAVFSVFLGRMAGVPSEGIPYPVFVYAGLLPWLYFAGALSAASESMVGSANLITKVYFPRLIVPAAAVLTGLVDLLVASAVLAVLMLYYGLVPGPAVLLLPALVALTALCAAGAGFWLAALNVEYRDIRYTVPFLIQLWMFASPVIYPSAIVPERYQWLFAFNPMAGLLKAFRASALGHQAVDWASLGISAAVIGLLLASGLLYFRRMERSFADVI